MRGSHRARGLGAGVFSQSLSYNRCPHEPAGRRWRWFPSWGFVPMTLRSIAALILVILLVWAEPGGCQTAAPAGAAESKHLLEHRQDFEKRLRLLADLLADPCVGPAKPGDDRDSAEHESRLFEDAAALVAEALNQTDLRAPGDRATSVLEELRKLSDTVNAQWPEENRFRFQILELGPMLVVRMSIRTYGAFSALALTRDDASGMLWRQIGSDEKTDFSSGLLELHPLYSPSPERVRFLARFLISGCAGSFAVEYGGWEWNSREGTVLTPIIGQKGVFGLDDRVPGFEQIGALKTDGRKVTLPFCWFSAIDTWDNPSLCAVDTYDLSGSEVRFQSRQVNRPDLVPLAKAIEYAQAHEYAALRAYCDSDAIAQKLMREVPPFIFAGAELSVTRRGTHRERVDLGDDTVYRFDLAERGGRWVVTGLGVQ